VYICIRETMRKRNRSFFEQWWFDFVFLILYLHCFPFLDVASVDDSKPMCFS
jgi:hypothetical protein